jgi:hypothetical protein
MINGAAAHFQGIWNPFIIEPADLHVTYNIPLLKLRPLTKVSTKYSFKIGPAAVMGSYWHCFDKESADHLSELNISLK